MKQINEWSKLNKTYIYKVHFFNITLFSLNKNTTKRKLFWINVTGIKFQEQKKKILEQYSKGNKVKYGMID